MVMLGWSNALSIARSRDAQRVPITGNTATTAKGNTMQNTKPNRAQRRAAQSNSKPKCTTPRFGSKLTIEHVELKFRNELPRPQISAPSRATRFAGIT